MEYPGGSRAAALKKFAADIASLFEDIVALSSQAEEFRDWDEMAAQLLQFYQANPDWDYNDQAQVPNYVIEHVERECAVQFQLDLFMRNWNIDHPGVPYVRARLHATQALTGFLSLTQNGIMQTDQLEMAYLTHVANRIEIARRSLAEYCQGWVKQAPRNAWATILTMFPPNIAKLFTNELRKD